MVRQSVIVGSVRHLVERWYPNIVGSDLNRLPLSRAETLPYVSKPLVGAVTLSASSVATDGNGDAGEGKRLHPNLLHASTQTVRKRVS